MSFHNNRRRQNQAGFTLTEMVVTIVLIGIVTVPIFTYFTTSTNQYFSLQKEGTEFSDIALQSQRIGAVLRGLTDITVATADSITCYGYFSPADQFVSLVRYFKTADNKSLKAEVTHLTANPPNGAIINSSLKTYTIIPEFFQAPGVSTFVYLDAANNALPIPITDLTTIKGMQINLAVPGGNLSANSNQSIQLQVALRNRKTNL